MSASTATCGPFALSPAIGTAAIIAGITIAGKPISASCPDRCQAPGARRGLGVDGPVIKYGMMDGDE
jgi:hypothetical protein